MVTLDDFSRIVSAIHAAAITPQHWIAAMEAVRSTVNGTSSGMILSDGTSRVIGSASLPPEARSSYDDYYRHHDYVLHAVEHGPVGLIRSGRSLVSLSAKSAFNADWMRPHGMDDGLFVRLTNEQFPASLVVAAPRGTNPFATAEHVHLVNALVPHLQQSLRTQGHLTDLVHMAHDVAVAVDGMRHGVFVLGSGSSVKYLNRVAEEILAVGDGPHVRLGRLGLRLASADALLHSRVAEALGRNGSAARTGNSLLCPRSGGKRPYVVHVVPFTSAPDGQEPRALAIVIDPERRAELPGELLGRLYGLTNAEAEVALRVTRGQGLKPIADELSLSLATVKTHLQRVFLKTETHRQAELVRLLLTIAP